MYKLYTVTEKTIDMIRLLWNYANLSPHAVPFVLKSELFISLEPCGERFQLFCASGPFQSTQLAEFSRVLLTDKPHRGEAKVAQFVVLVARPAPYTTGDKELLGNIYALTVTPPYRRATR